MKFKLLGVIFNIGSPSRSDSHPPPLSPPWPTSSHSLNSSPTELLAVFLLHHVLANLCEYRSPRGKFPFTAVLCLADSSHPRSLSLAPPSGRPLPFLLATRAGPCHSPHYSGVPRPALQPFFLLLALLLDGEFLRAVMVSQFSYFDALIIFSSNPILSKYLIF